MASPEPRNDLPVVSSGSAIHSAMTHSPCQPEDNAEIALFAVIDRQGNIVAANDAWLEFAQTAGMSTDSDLKVGANYLEICRRGASGCLAASQAMGGVEQVLAGKRQACTFEFSCRRDGKTVAYLMTASTLPERDGLFYLNLTDITHYRRTAEQLQTQVANVARLATGAELVTGVAHELNQPLFAILNYAKACRLLLDKNPIDRTRLEAYSDEIAAAAVSAGQIIRRMREFAGVRPVDRETENLAALLSETLELLSYDMRRRDVEVLVDIASPNSAS